MDTKPIWQSKVFWVNLLTLAVLLLGVLVAPEYGEVAKWAALALPIVNIVLRFLTNTAVTLK